MQCKGILSRCYLIGLGQVKGYGLARDQWKVIAETEKQYFILLILCV